MKELLRKKIDSVIKKEFKVKIDDYDIIVSEKEDFGDFSTNVAFVLAKEVKKSPKEIAEKIVGALYITPAREIQKVEVAGGGFINFFLDSGVYEKELNIILRDKSKYGSNKSGKEKKIQVEFISANPTGPLTLGNGRGGFSGDTLSNVLKKNGYKVKKEYYVNDAGNQVKHVLAKSIYKSLGIDIHIEEGEEVYGGEYIEYIARKLKKQKKIEWIRDNFEKVGELGAKVILEEFIKKDIKFLGIKFDHWFSEKSLFKDKLIEKMWRYLKTKNLVYEQDGAYWLKTSKYGDEKDRVVQTTEGEPTYLMSDIAYLYERLGFRKFDKIIMILGADHHGYVGRMLAVEQMLKFGKKLDIIVTQFIRLIENGQEVRMSKRKGTFVTLREAVEEMGIEAARYFFISKDFNQHIDIDLEIAKAESNKNPIFYIQYASARINSVLKKVKVKPVKKAVSKVVFDKYESALMKKLTQYPEIVKAVGENYEVYKLAFYAYDIAEAFHKFYDNCRTIGDEREDIRLKIIKATRIVLGDCLGLMGIKAKEKM